MFSSIKIHIITIAVATILSGFSLASILRYTDPETSSLLIFCFLFTSIFIFAAGILTLCGYFSRNLAGKGTFTANLSNSLRQGLLLSIYLVICLILSSFDILFWWIALTLFLPFACLEIFLNLRI